MSSTSSDPPTKDRKRSAHWSDEDTETLIAVLIRVKDTGRTPDNGFRPEIWREVSNLLESSTFMGGPKTPEACKSRWQRLQRDFRAAKKVETMPGFTWDRSNHRLSASEEAWEQAEKLDTSCKYRKIYLPWWDSLAIVCADESIRSRPRHRNRASLASISSSSSILNMAAPSGESSNQMSQVGQMSHPVTMSQVGRQPHHSMNNGQIQINGHQHQHQHPHQQMHGPSGNAGNALVQLSGQLQATDHAVFSWEGEQNGNGDFDGSFGLSNGSQSYLPHKRAMPFDPSLLESSQNQQHSLSMSQGSAPKKQRTSNSRPVLNHQLGNMHPNQQYAYLSTSNPQQSNPGAAQSNQQSPEFSTSTPMLDPSILHTPPGIPIKTFSPTTPNSAANMALHSNTDLATASFSEAQRRTEALIQLQNQEVEMRDEDLSVIVSLFEANVATADTYLAIKRESLRKVWLMSLLQRRGC